VDLPMRGRPPALQAGCIKLAVSLHDRGMTDMSAEENLALSRKGDVLRPRYADGSEHRHLRGAALRQVQQRRLPRSSVSLDEWDIATSGPNPREQLLHPIRLAPRPTNTSPP
jgi:hypothetical protein